MTQKSVMCPCRFIETKRLHPLPSLWTVTQFTAP
jgi:hypothetical protein